MPFNKASRVPPQPQPFPIHQYQPAPLASPTHSNAPSYAPTAMSAGSSSRSAPSAAHTTSHQRFPSSGGGGGGGAVLFHHQHASSAGSPLRAQVITGKTGRGMGTIAGPGSGSSSYSSGKPKQGGYMRTDSLSSSSSDKLPVSSYASVFATPHVLHGMLADDEDDAGYRGYKENAGFTISGRGFVNLATLTILVVGLLTLFAGYPIIQHFTKKQEQTHGAFGLGGTNGTGQVPITLPHLSLVDIDTPAAAKTWTSPISKEDFRLVFSDEFETEGRTFWPGDDPFWEAVNLWYGATGNYEWYHPEQINTTRGALHMYMEQKPLNNLNFRSGMLQSWNKFCFQGGYIEFNAILPGSPEEVGWWPGLWLQGNLGRPGYLGTTDGMWPYSYDSCDSGILPNQTAAGRTGYDDVFTYRQPDRKTGLSWNPGMRTPSCTCSGEDHPGPNVNTGRGAPELDILEAQINTRKGTGEASQSLQTAPFDKGHKWGEAQATIYDEDLTRYNSFAGNVYQETVSGVSTIPNKAYAKNSNTYTTFGVEFLPDFTKGGKGTTTWYIDGKATWTVTEDSIGPRPDIDIGQRFVPMEPMTIIMNLGISRGFQSDLDFDTLKWPAIMSVDYVRVYQPNSWPGDKVSCSPDDYPTTDYINRHPDVYNDPQVVLWKDPMPRNRLTTGC